MKRGWSRSRWRRPAPSWSGCCRRFRRAVDEGALSDVQRDWDPSGGERGIRVRTTEAGLVRIEATLDPAEAALVLAAIEKTRDELRAATGAVTATTSHVSAETRGRAAEPPAPGRADGLIAIAERTLAPRASRARAAPVAAAVTSIRSSFIWSRRCWDLTARARRSLTTEHAFPRRRSGASSCDGALVAVTTGEGGAVLDVGRKTRAVPAAIRRALWSRDRGCRFPMCSNRRFVDAHHVHHWVHGGRTSLDNLVLLCGFHHRLLHEGGFRMSLDAAGAAHFFTPAGAEIAPVPEVPSVSARGRHRSTIPTPTCAAGTANASTTTRRSTRSSPLEAGDGSRVRRCARTCSALAEAGGRQSKVRSRRRPRTPSWDCGSRRTAAGSPCGRR